MNKKVRTFIGKDCNLKAIIKWLKNIQRGIKGELTRKELDKIESKTSKLKQKLYYENKQKEIYKATIVACIPELKNSDLSNFFVTEYSCNTISENMVEAHLTIKVKREQGLFDTIEVTKRMMVNDTVNYSQLSQGASNFNGFFNHIIVSYGWFTAAHRHQRTCFSTYISIYWQKTINTFRALISTLLHGDFPPKELNAFFCR